MPRETRVPIFQISGTGIAAARGYASSRTRTIVQCFYGRYQEFPRLLTMVLLMEARMHFGSALLTIWLVIGCIAAGQRGDYTHHIDCSSASTIGVTILAGPLNYTGVDPHINCTTPQPSN